MNDFKRGDVYINDSGYMNVIINVDEDAWDGRNSSLSYDPNPKEYVAPISYTSVNQERAIYCFTVDLNEYNHLKDVYSLDYDWEKALDDFHKIFPEYFEIDNSLMGNLIRKEDGELDTKKSPDDIMNIIEELKRIGLTKKKPGCPKCGHRMYSAYYFEDKKIAYYCNTCDEEHKFTIRI